MADIWPSHIFSADFWQLMWVWYQLIVICGKLCLCVFFRVTADLGCSAVRWGKVWMCGTEQCRRCIFISCQPRCSWYWHNIVIIMIVLFIAYLLYVNYFTCYIVSTWVRKVIKILRIESEGSFTWMCASFTFWSQYFVTLCTHALTM